MGRLKEHFPMAKLRMASLRTTSSMAKVKESRQMALFSKASSITEFYWISDFLKIESNIKLNMVQPVPKVCLRKC